MQRLISSPLGHWQSMQRLISSPLGHWHGEVLSHETFVCSKWCISVALLALLLGTGIKGANYAKPKPTYINIFLSLPSHSMLSLFSLYPSPLILAITLAIGMKREK